MDEYDRPSRSMARDIGAVGGLGGERRMGYRKSASRNGRLGEIHSLGNRFDHDVDGIMA
jgi:hypothetical protein